MKQLAIEVVAPGSYASLQDLGRRGLRRVGVPWAGALDPRLMRIANALVGNHEHAAVIECFDGGLQLAARGGLVRVAVAGDTTVEIERGGQRQTLAAWRSLCLADGDVLRLRRLERGRIAVIAIEGLEVAEVLGSVSTYPRALLGGLDGRALTAGVRIPVAPATERREQMLPDPARGAFAPIRVVAGPQADHFSPAMLQAFTESDYHVTGDADRMGLRLEGLALEHLGSREIVSDATVPGSIQVPGNGQPIVLLADAQTAGGYPKIGTVIGADLPRLAAARPGQTVRFALVDSLEAEQLARAAEAETRALIASLRPLTVGGVDEAAIYACNLVSGVVDALASDPASSTSHEANG